PTGPFAAFAPPPTMGPVVPGQSFDVKLRFTNRGSVDVTVASVDVAGTTTSPATTLKRDRTLTLLANITVPADAAFTRPYFLRPSIVESRYTVSNNRALHHPASPPAFVAAIRYTVAGVPVDINVPVARREAQLPFGTVMRELAVVPALAVTVSPRQAIVPQAMANKSVRVH